MQLHVYTLWTIALHTKSMVKLSAITWLVKNKGPLFTVLMLSPVHLLLQNHLMFACLFWNTPKKQFYCAIKLNSCIMLSFIYVRTKFKWLLLNRDLQFRTFPCSSWVTAKRLFLHKWKPNLSNWGQSRLFHLSKSSLSKWKYLFSKSHPTTFSGGFRVGSRPPPPTFLMWYCSFFKQLLKDFYH